MKKSPGKGRVRRKAYYGIMLSYIALLIIPLMTFSFFTFHSFSGFYGESILKSRQTEFERLQSTMDMILEQMGADAYALLGNRALSTAAVKEAYGNYLDVTLALSTVTNTNRFIENAFYINDELRHVFTSVTMYTYEDFTRFSYGYDHEPQILLLQNKRQYVLPCQNIRQGLEQAVTFVYTDKCSAEAVHSAVFFQMSKHTLDSLVGRYLKEADTVTVLSDNAGSLLYAGSPDAAPLWEAYQNSTGRASGQTFSFAGVEYVVFSMPSQVAAISYMAFVPYTSIMRPVRTMQLSAITLLIGILALCGLVIMHFTRMNYKPIRDLVSIVTQHSAPEKPMGELELVADAFTRVQRLNHSLQVDDITLRLLRSCYPTLEALKKHGESLSYPLNGPLFRVLVLGIAQREAGEVQINTHHEISRLVKRRVIGLCQIVNLLYPESSQIYLVLSGTQAEMNEALEHLGAARKELGELFGLTICVGYSDCGEIATASRLLSQARSACHMASDQAGEGISGYSSDQQDLLGTGEYPRQAMEALKQTFLTAGRERILFALEPLLNTIRDTKSHFFAMRLCYNIVNTSLSAMEEMGYPTKKLSAKYPMLFSNTASQGVEEMIHIIRLFIDEVSEHAAQQPQEPEMQEKLQEILHYIDEGCHEENFSAKSLADHFDMTVSNLSHYFKKYTQVTVSDYISLRRFDNAKTLLRETAMPVQEVAARCGYVHISTFLRQFKKYENTTPAAYRQAYRQ